MRRERASQSVAFTVAQAGAMHCSHDATSTPTMDGIGPMALPGGASGALGLLILLRVTLGTFRFRSPCNR